MTGGRGVDVAIEALGLATTFENALRVVRPDGTVSSLGVYSGDLTIPLDAFAAGLGDKRIVTTLCITDAYELFANQRDGVLKGAITA